jgi:hypothetical protein
MKLNGYMVHWYEIEDNLSNTSFVAKHDKSQKLLNIKKITHLGKKLNKKRIVKWHLVYCLAILIFKIFGFPILYLLIMFSSKVQLYLAGVDRNMFFGPNFNSTLLYGKKKGLFQILNSFTEVTYLVQISIYPCIFLIFSIMISYFEKSAVAFNEAENELISCFTVYNKRVTVSDQKLTYKKNHFGMLKLIYGLVSLIFFGGCFQFILEVESDLAISYRTTQGELFKFFFTVSLIIFVIDYIISIYFLFNLLILSIYQLTAFADYVKAIVNDINLGKDLHEFDIENIRETYLKLSNYVEHVDSWICVILFLIYSTSVPSLCSYFFILIAGDDEFSIKKNGIMIFSYLFQLVILTLLGIILNFKVIFYFY